LKAAVADVARRQREVEAAAASLAARVAEMRVVG
jgi:hypothetical protein